jgi:hypothetical protein
MKGGRHVFMCLHPPTPSRVSDITLRQFFREGAIETVDILSKLAVLDPATDAASQ